MKLAIIGLVLLISIALRVASSAAGAELPRVRVGVLATGAFLRDHRSIVEQFVNGFLEGVDYAKTHKDESLPLIKEFMLRARTKAYRYFHEN